MSHFYKKYPLQKEENHFDTVWDIYTQSFALEERRDREHFCSIMNVPQFYPCYYKKKETVVAILFYWQFEEFYYIEHFAVDHRYRGTGIGESILQQFSQEVNSAIILEVEKPVNNSHWRRISFYQRNGFSLLKQGYFQPPYRKEDKKVALSLMSYPLPMEDSLVDKFVTKYHPIIYPDLE